MNINWDAVGAGAELVGAVATVSTLAYLALQIRQANKVARFSAATTRAERWTQLSSFLSQSPEINRVFRVGLQTPELLAEQEYHYFEAIFSTVLASYQGSFYLQREDVLFVAEWESALENLKWLVATPCFGRFWANWKKSYPGDFVAFVDQLAGQAGSARVSAGV